MRYLKQSTSVDLPIGPFVDQTDGFTAESGLTLTQPDIRLKKNGAAWAQKNAAQTLSHEENGYYEVTLDATDTDTLGQLMLAVNESGALPVFHEFMVMPANVWDSLFGADLLQTDSTQLLGTAYATPTVAGVPEVDVTHWLGTACATPTVAGVPEVDVTHLVGDSTSAADLKDFADAGYDPATNKVQGVVLTDTVTTYTGNTVQTGDAFARLGAPAGASVSADVAAVQADTNDIQTRLPAALVSGRMDSDVGAMQNGTITAAVIATDAIDADAIAASAVTEIQSGLGGPIVSGTSDSGSTTTMVDAARTEADADHWKGATILFTSGTISGQSRLITAFTPGTDTITFAPATTQAVSTETYEIHKAARVDVELWDGSAVNALVSGRVDARVGAMATDTLTADALAADAVTEIQSGLATAAALTTVDDFLDTEIADIQARLPATLSGGKMRSQVEGMDAGTVTAAAVATGAIDADALANDATAEIADTLLNRDMSAVSDTNARTPLNALRFLRNKWGISAGTLTVTKEDDSTSAWTSALTTDAGAVAIVTSDPA